MSICALAGLFACGAGSTAAGQVEAVQPPQESAANEVEIPLDAVPAEVREQFAKALAELTAEDWSRREAAGSYLEQSAVPDAVFEAMLRSRTLAPEQEHRVVAVLRDRALGRERGAMGIKMTTGSSPVQVIEVRPNMPAWGRLQVGDTIIDIDGNPIVTSTDLEAVLADRQPGDEVDVTVRRRNEGGNPALDPFDEDMVTVRIKLTDDSLFTEEERLARRQERVLRARDVVVRYAPRVTPLRMPLEGSTADEPAEIAALRAQIAEYIAADEGARRALREQWRATRDGLLLSTLASGITDAERQRRWELYSAYVELLPPGVD